MNKWNFKQVTIAVWIAFFLFLHGAVWAEQSPPGSQPSAIVVTKTIAGLWQIKALRDLSRRSAVGTIHAVVAGEIDRDNPPHAMLAGAMAWSQLSSEFLAVGAFEKSAEAARNGIDELGDSYYLNPTTGKISGVIDDSSQRILAAEILMHERAADGAAMLRRILEGRIQQYFQFYEESLVPD
ncbi:MAG: hypothetical protein CL388_07515 [Acidiferrobacteraceae bacterium]|nr:hypothetical protein [Acidiferrobacteraceae bacterium]MDP6434127.1 hypothetical protein [Arenicellales bacterium]MDP6671688.1 hypothetical protein [Arenicellales bacterium]MDP6725022.1 hypothetical protein [Arenicellales bacterium]